MTPADLRATLARLGLPQTGAAKLLGVEARQVRRWLAGEVPVPVLVCRVLRLMESGKLKPSDLLP